MNRKPKAILATAAVGAVGLFGIAVGAVAGSSTEATPEPTVTVTAPAPKPEPAKTVTAKPEPAPTVTVTAPAPKPEVVTETETKEVTPQSCLDALDVTADFAEIVKRYPMLVAEALEAGMAYDDAKIQSIADEMNGLSDQINGLTVRMGDAAPDCRAKASGE